MPKYLKFKTIENNIVVVTSKKHNDILGYLKYYKPWKQWTLISDLNVVWSWECLKDVQEALITLNKQGSVTNG